MAEGYLTTHVLDTARGLPADGLQVELFRIEGHERAQVARTMTNADGRTDTPILPPDAFQPGIYELVFHAGAYLDSIGAPGGSPRFLTDIPIRFAMREGHYHVPLLLSPFGYSTYRGS
ncbi:hydroxyisourate hydrolase [Rhodobacteraceae bacterium CCMM004]|nr:hydroxyisourate hydrolase [Rhodobacteraceae bacterium CCMM004]